MTDTKKEFKKVAIPAQLKMEIAVLAAQEQRHEYQIVIDALSLYKQVAMSKNKRNKKLVPVTDVIATH